MSEEQKRRLWQLIKPWLEVLLLGILYVIIIKTTGWMIPCPIKWVTGKHCPGCGVSRMLLAMFQFDFVTAYHANRLLFFLLPIICLYGIVKGVQFVRTGENKQSAVEQIGILMVCIATLVFWVMRNMERFAFLAPMG